MNKYIPFRDNVVVRLVTSKEQKVGDIVIPGKLSSKWIKMEVIAVGPKVEELLKKGDIVLAEAMFEKVDSFEDNIGLILSRYIHTRIEEVKES